MDLAKSIAELRVELQCLDTAIASIEELARVQNLTFAGVRPATTSEAEPVAPEAVPEDAAPVKRGRGRPRKNPAPAVGETSQPMGDGSAQSNDGSTVSAA